MRQEQARQEEEKRKEGTLEQEPPENTKFSTSADAYDSETETEVGGVSKTRRRRVNQPETAKLSPESALQSKKSSDIASAQRKTSEGDGSGYTSTDSEWEKVDKDRPTWWLMTILTRFQHLSEDANFVIIRRLMNLSTLYPRRNYLFG